jgi:prephenate dehydratase
MAEAQRTGSSSHTKMRMAYLGPEGTYGHQVCTLIDARLYFPLEEMLMSQAAKRFVSAMGEPVKEVELIPCPTIPGKRRQPLVTSHHA